MRSRVEDIKHMFIIAESKFSVWKRSRKREHIFFISLDFFLEFSKEQRKRFMEESHRIKTLLLALTSFILESSQEPDCGG